MTLGTLLLILSLVCFLLAAAGVPTRRLSLTPLGLAFLVLAMLVGHVVLNG